MARAARQVPSNHLAVYYEEGALENAEDAHRSTSRTREPFFSFNDGHTASDLLQILICCRVKLSCSRIRLHFDVIDILLPIHAHHMGGVGQVVAPGGLSTGLPPPHYLIML